MLSVKTLELKIWKPLGDLIDKSDYLYSLIGLFNLRNFKKTTTLINLSLAYDHKSVISVLDVFVADNWMLNKLILSIDIDSFFNFIIEIQIALNKIIRKLKFTRVLELRLNNLNENQKKDFLDYLDRLNLEIPFILTIKLNKETYLTYT